MNCEGRNSNTLQRFAHHHLTYTKCLFNGNYLPSCWNLCVYHCNSEVSNAAGVRASLESRAVSLEAEVSAKEEEVAQLRVRFQQNLTNFIKHKPNLTQHIPSLHLLLTI